MDPVIEIKNISFTYPDAPAPALNGVSLDILPGSFVAVLGANGSGKSTLAKHLNAILLPSEGTVSVRGLDTRRPENLIPIRRRVGMVFQNPDNQIVANVVEDDVAFAPENLGVPPEEIRRRVDGSLRHVGMYEYRLHAPHLLSGGQKQRVAIAGVLAMQPEVLVLDEPTAMLDPRGRREVIETVEALCRSDGITVVLITHHMEEAARADRVVVMDRGRAVLEGTPVEVFSQAGKVFSLGLDIPEMMKLAFKLRKGGVALPEGIMTVDEMAVELCRLK